LGTVRGTELADGNEGKPCKDGMSEFMLGSRPEGEKWKPTADVPEDSRSDETYTKGGFPEANRNDLFAEDDKIKQRCRRDDGNQDG
jgi:hypothetical protein